MAFDGLSERLQGVFDKLRKKGKLEKNVQIGNLFYDLNTKE